MGCTDMWCLLGILSLSLLTQPTAAAQKDLRMSKSANRNK